MHAFTVLPMCQGLARSVPHLLEVCSMVKSPASVQIADRLSRVWQVPWQAENPLEQALCGPVLRKRLAAPRQYEPHPELEVSRYVAINEVESNWHSMDSLNDAHGSSVRP